MKLTIIIILVLAGLITSCGTSSPDQSKKKVAVQELGYSGYGGWYSHDPIVIRYVDTMYHIGDTVVLDARYVIRRD